MTVLTPSGQAQIPVYSPAPPTTAELDYADLPIIDFSYLATEADRTTLAGQIKDAILQHGFFYVINHGYTSQQTKRVFDIANASFDNVPEADKQTYTSNIKGTGSWQGYKPRRYFHIDNGVHDRMEMYSINRDVTKRIHPEPIRPFLPEVQAFAKHNHFDVLHPILRLLALGLEISEETFVNMHRWDAVGETYVRFMKYYPRTPEKSRKPTMSDIGTITLLYSQPVSALQILTREGTWKWVKHIDNAIVVNTGDAMEFLSGGYYRPTIHRVVQPPPDQQTYTRLGLFYFALTNDDVKLAPVSSPVLQQVGIDNTRFMDNPAFDVKGDIYPTMEAWRKGRTSAYGQSELVKKGKVEEELIEGVVVKHYN
ncbi:hypothetical protein D9756_009416 [Leucocoprinus leucothites]|uniref:Clavaminate synthase-like protein n=1 Tax=Leucocoprinus leucothites TaxID=201217 RepID=A0A8H5CY82_9AGAR|nr:hypothetical protein D9756_009416 [Leucoagaricus leucothites]